MTNGIVKTSAPGKIILSGEHVVVHGYPALVASVSLRSGVTIEKIQKGVEVYPKSAGEIILRGVKNFEDYFNKDVFGAKITLDSEIPIGAGMGSSAGVAVSLSAALMKFYEDKFDTVQINKLADMSENYYHKSSSGVDATISTYGGFLWYRKETEKLKLFSKVENKTPFNNIVIINSGKPEETTGDMVSIVSEKYKSKPNKINKVFIMVENITRNFYRYVEGNTDISIKDLIYENERCLEELDVVSVMATDLIKKIEKLGGSAKISGAGGKKGASGMIIAYHPDKEKLMDYLKKEKLNIMDVKFGTKGVEIEK